MSAQGTGLQATTNANAFLGLTAPIHLPTLASNKGEDSPHLPMAHKTQCVEVQGITDIPPERQGVDFGHVDYFKYIANDNEILETCELAVKLDGLAPGANGDNPRYVDDIVCAMVDKVDFVFGGNILQSLYGDEIHFRLLQETPEDEMTRRQKLQGGGLSNLDRAHLAAGPKWYYLEIPFWWARTPGSNWHQYAFQRLTRIIFHFRDRGYLLQSDAVVQGQSVSLPTPLSGANSPYIMDHFLRFHVTCPAEATKQVYMRMVEAQGDNGWLHLINDWERMTDINLRSGATTHVVLLNQFTKFGYNLRYVIRPAANLLPNVLNNRRWDVVSINSHAVDISGKKFIPELDDHYLKHSFNGKHFLGNENLPIYNVFFTNFPDMHNHGMGGFEFANTTNPTLTIKTDALDGDHSLDVYLYCHNYVRLVLRGAQSAAETVQPL